MTNVSDGNGTHSPMNSIDSTIGHLSSSNSNDDDGLSTKDGNTTMISMTDQKIVTADNDPKNPMNWPKKKKYVNFFIVSAISFMGYFSSAIYMPATEQIRAYFDTDLTIINISIAFFVLFLGVAPLFFAPLSERIGRRWIYLTGTFFFTVFTILCGTSTNLGAFMAFRLIQGIFASVGMAIGGGSCSDLFDTHERGTAVSLYMFGTILGPAVAPISGGYIANYLGWRWIFYIKTILGGVLFILSFFFLQETLYVSPDALPLPSSGTVGWKARVANLKFNPLATLGLLLRPEIGLLCLAVSTFFGWFYLLVTILPATFNRLYGFSSDTIGIMYLAGGIGNTSGAIVAGLISDRLYNWQVKRNNGARVIEFRLTPIYFGIPFIVIGALLYGWALQYALNQFVPLAGYLLYTFGTMLTITISNTYLVESFLSRSASVVSVNNCLRNVFAMFFSSMAVIIRNGLGDNWTYTVAAITCLLMYIPTFLVQKYGSKWRPTEPL
ncbi:major facilitator superfamily domain-containing protein [Absidia repens]|uniref:Major facilitator superfamily domain-containing protein n=1 Tax=Absidia repens TaxID=90262 RepID=A0A1X2INJ0_9FUNG|nr:major facilitator superfamily domain-containing protein [Absidia repens]